MTNWKNLLLLFSITVNLAAVASLFYFWGRFDHMRRLPAVLQRPDRGAPSAGPLWRRLELQEPQRQALQKFRAPYNEQIRQQRQRIEESRRRLMEILQTQPGAQDSIKYLLARVAEDQAVMEKMTVEHLLALRPLLDERQWRIMLMSFNRDRRAGRELGPMNSTRPF
jgi:Spy/CpxP family protein refolding chaperone